jgi:hypothetical protein
MTLADGTVVRVTGGPHARRTGTVQFVWPGGGRETAQVDLDPFGKLEAEEDVQIATFWLVPVESKEVAGTEVAAEVELMAALASVYEMCREKETECLHRIATGCQKTELDIFKEPEQIRAELQGTKDMARRVMMVLHDLPLWPVLEAQIRRDCGRSPGAEQHRHLEFVVTTPCSVCGKEIGEEEADRNLLAIWEHCDGCMADLLVGLVNLYVWQWAKEGDGPPPLMPYDKEWHGHG